MEFIENQPIYLQINDWICDKILCGEWAPEQRIPSVRELGAFLEVNPNTVMRTYERLQAAGIIYNRRGIGFFVAVDAPGRVGGEARRAFFDDELPRVFDRMRALEITPDEVVRHWEEFCLKNGTNGADRGR